MDIMTAYPWKVRTDARNIYLYGTRKLADETAEYVEPIKQYAAQTFTIAQIENARTLGWITEQEYIDTLAYVPPAV